MAKPKLPTDYRERPLDAWTAHQFRQYLADKHVELYGIAYVTRSIAMEAKMIRNMIDEHGAELTKQFIDRCFIEYKPTPQYPSLNFAFMYSYMKERVLPKLLAEKARQERMAQVQPVISDEELSEWL